LTKLDLAELISGKQESLVDDKKDTVVVVQHFTQIRHPPADCKEFLEKIAKSPKRSLDKLENDDHEKSGLTEID